MNMLSKFGIFGLLFFVFNKETLAVTSMDSIKIIPEPVLTTLLPGRFEVNEKTHLIFNTIEAERLVRKLKSKIDAATGYRLRYSSFDRSSNENVISFLLNEKFEVELGQEGYSLLVSTERIEVRANATQGLFYGLMTLLQLLPPEIEGEAGRLNNLNIQCLQIKDFPRFQWRGIMLDVSRHFQPKEFIKSYIVQLAKYKYNIFHWHLTDDHGWRIEIEGLSKLTEIGAWKPSRIGRPGRFEPPQPHEMNTEGGFYTQSDIKEIVAFAKEHFITIVPEIDLPGHSLALITAYPDMSCTKTKYPPQVGTPGFNGSLEVCVGNVYTWQILDSIFTQVCELFPSEYVHIGGDEVRYDFWLNCSHDRRLMETEGLSSGADLQAYFTSKLEKLVLSKGKKIIGWDDILHGQLDSSSIAMSWRGLGLEKNAAVRGHNAIMCPENFTYLNYAQGDTIVEPYFPRTIRLSTSYEFDPIAPSLPDSLHRYILGGQGNLWTENVFHYRHVEYMTWPRAIALSEVFWSPLPKRNWVNFCDKIEDHFLRFDYANINYSRALYDPIISGVIDSTIVVEKYESDTSFYPEFHGQFLDPRIKVVLSSEVPGLDIYYTFDNSNPDNFYSKYDGKPITIPKGALGDSEIRVVTYRNGKPIGRQINCKLAEAAKRLQL